VRWERGLSPFLLIGAAVLLSHAPLLRADYVQDDHLVVESGREAPLLLGSYWEGVKGGDRSLYRPVTLATYAAERALAGRARPDVSHAINLLLHMGVAALVLALGRGAGLDPAAALLGALLFALTPAKTEAVANVVGRAEVLAALFTLAALRLASGATRVGAWGAAACVLLACGSKETGFVALPLVACAALLASSSRRTRWGILLPSLLAFEIAVIARTLALEAWLPRQVVPVMDNPLVALSGTTYGATALGLAARAAGIVAVPWGLAGDYSGPTIPPEAGLLAWRPLAGAVVLIVLAALSVGGFVARRGAIAWGGAIALGAYLITSNLVVPVGAIFAERFLYLPAAGLALLAAAALDRTGPRARAIAAVLCVVYGVLNVFVAGDWRSDATRFAAVARHNPASPRAALWLGVLAAERGDDPAARRELSRAAALWPDFAAPHLHLGLLDAKAGDFRSAARQFEEAARREPTWAVAQLNLALARHRAEDREAAERAARRACILDPDNPRAWAELGHLRYERGAKREAIEPYRRAVTLGRGDLAARLAECEAS
jgi:protein O-mannosyl-transferase